MVDLVLVGRMVLCCTSMPRADLERAGFVRSPRGGEEIGALVTPQIDGIKASGGGDGKAG